MARLDGTFTLRDVLMRAAGLYGNRPAVICGDLRFTWAELANRTHQAAAWLTSLGVERGHRVLLLSENRAEIVEIAYAVAELGAVLVPLSPISAEAEVRHASHDSGATLGLATAGLRELATATGGHVEELGGSAYESMLSKHPCREPPIVEHVDDPVLQFYTSGTTGMAKGVLMSQGAMIVHGLSTALSQSQVHEEVFLTCAPLTHAAGGTRIFSLGAQGVTHVILKRWSPKAFYEAVERNLVTTTVLVPSMIADLLADPELDQADLSSLRLVVYGAAPTPPPVLRAALERMPCGFLHSYGTSEACTALTVLTPAEHDAARADPELAHRLQSVGRPVPGVRFRIVGEDGIVVAAETVGHIEVRSSKMMVDYWHQPAGEPSVWHNGWMATGDLGFLDADGYLYVAGRSKEMIISGGLNVYPSEIEAVLAEHPAVHAVAVVGADHERFGQTPVAFVVLSQEASDEALVDHCSTRLARYKRPSRFIRVAALPRTDTGKVRKSELAAELLG